MENAYTLTRTDARVRTANLTVETIDVDIDISGASSDDAFFPVTSTIHMKTQVPATFIDLVGRVLSVHVNGEEWPYDHRGSQLFIDNLPIEQDLSIVVSAMCAYSRTGEGLHRYIDPEDGRFYLYTQFEPTDAHRAWPCFDQPDIKPRWSFHVTAPSEWVVTSNGAVEKCEHRNEAMTWHFTQTPPLSSYITAIVAGQYAVVDAGMWEPSSQTIAACAQAKDLRIPLRLMCRQSLAPFMDSDDIVEVTRQGLDYYHQNYRVAYPWGTYDQIFVPEYNLGAMENPGCVTFNERMLSRDTPTFAQRQSRANVILHEMCHMWFGDLATPAWWDDLWLKESFADNQGTMAAAEATQYTGEWASFAVERKAWAYQQDLYPTTHPIAADIPDVSAAKNNFDGITYAKGAAVLKQLVAWVGRDAFFNAAHRYFHQHSFSATSLRDLLDALRLESGINLDTWEKLWLHTTKPSEFSTTWTVGPQGQIRDFFLTHTTEEENDLRRPHQVMISIYRCRDGALVKTHSFPVRVESQTTLIDVDSVLDVPDAVQGMDLVLINDEDLTYAVTRFDEHSMETALALVSTISDATSRAVVWSTLWLAVRDGLLRADEYVAAVLRHAPAETDEAVVERLLTTVGIAIGQYTPARERDLIRRECVTACRQILAGELSEDRRREWAALLLSSLRGCDILGEEDSALLCAASQGEAVEIPATQAMKWAAFTALAARGELTQEKLDTALAAAHTGEAQVHYVRASAAIPDATVRMERWDAVCQETLSNDELSATLEGLQISSWKGDELQQAFFAQLRPFWESHSLGMGIRFIRAGFPAAIDIDTDGLSSDLLHHVDTWLSDNMDAPHALRRLIIERRDDVLRALNAQRAFHDTQAQPSF